MTASISTKSAPVESVENDSKAGTALLAGLRKAAKAADSAADKAGKAKAAEEAIGYLSGARGIYGDPKQAADAMLKADDMAREVESLREQYSTAFSQWLKIAHESKHAGVTAAGWAAATESSAMMLGRLSGAWALVLASRENGTPVSPVEAYRIANRLQRNEVDAMVLAYVEAEEGVDPYGEGDAVKAVKEAKPVTVEQYVKALTALGETLSTLQAGDFPTPKAETLESLKASQQVFERLSKQHATLIGKVERAGKTPKGAKADTKAA